MSAPPAKTRPRMDGMDAVDGMDSIPESDEAKGSAKGGSRDRLLIRLRLAIFLLAALVRFGYGASVRGTALDRFHEWAESDMHTYVEQSRRIAEGDWLGRAPFHPYHMWQSAAPPARWESWYPPLSFHQAPGYSYFLAALRLLFGARFVGAAKFLQALLGAGSALLVFELTRRAAASLNFERGSCLLAGAAAGAVAACYGPLVVIEAQLLRDGPSLFLALCAALALASASSPAAPRPLRRLALSGALLGGLTLFHETGQVLILAAALGVGLAGWRLRGPAAGRWLAAGRALLALGAGVGLGMSPLIARNLAVGSPPLAISSRTLVVFAMSNDADAPAGGSEWGRVGPGFADLMDAAGGSFARLAVEVARSYHGDAARALRNWGRKIRAQAMVHEAPDNISHDFMRAKNPFARLMPGFWIIFAPGLAGLSLALRAGGRCNGGPPPIVVQLALFVLALAGALSLVHALGRLRLMAAPWLMIFAGLLAGELWRAFRARGSARRGGFWTTPLASAAPVFALAAGFQAYAQAAVAPATLRPGDFIVTANSESQVGDWAQAAVDYAEARRLGMTSPDVDAALGWALWRSGRRADAIAAWSRGLPAPPTPPAKQSAAMNPTPTAPMPPPTAAARLIATRLAWALATAPEADLRDGPRALALARAVVEASSERDPAAWVALAAARAELGDFPAALAALDRAEASGTRPASPSPIRESLLAGRPLRDGGE